MNKKEAIKYLQQLYPNGGHCWLDEQRIEAIDMAVKALREEPVSGDFENALAEEWKGYNDRGAAKVDALEDNTQELAFAKGFYRGWHYKKEESVCEDLETEIEWYMTNVYCGDTCIDDVARHFANWQKEQFEKNRLKHCDSITNEQAELEQGFIDQHLDKHNRMPTFLDAIEYGMRLKEKQMMAKAINTEASYTMSVPCICISLPLGVKVGDKVKVIVIKYD